MNKAWISFGIAIASLFIGVGASHAENPEHVRKLLQTNNCKGCDLSNASLDQLDLRNANLAGANLEGADLTNTQLTRANLQNANLQKARITSVNFNGANLKDANLAEAENLGLCQGNETMGFSYNFGYSSSQESSCLVESLINVFEIEELCTAEYNLQGLDLGSVFCEAIDNHNWGTSEALNVNFGFLFKFASFIGADLTNTNLDSINLAGADLRYANLNNVNIKGTILDYANLINANLHNVPKKALEYSFLDISDARRLLQTAIAQEAEARRISIGIETLGTLNRAQQAYRLENGRFADRINETDAILKKQSEYLFKIVPQPDPTQSVVTTALSQSPDLKSYISIASQIDDFFAQLICETEEPSQELPPFDFTTNSDQCPTGMQEVEQ